MISRTAPPSPRDRSLLHDDGGAMMITAVFMATTVIGMLYYINGIGNVLTFRERMQDAADAGAMIGAISMARSMNLIVTANIALASIFALAVITQRALSILTVATTIAGVRCAVSYWTGEVEQCAALICMLFAPRCDLKDAREEAESIVEDFDDSTHDLMNQIRLQARALASAQAMGFVSENYQPPELNLSLPTTFGNLPVEDDDDHNPICDQYRLSRSGAIYMMNVFAGFDLATPTIDDDCGSDAQEDGYIASAIHLPMGPNPACKKSFNRVEPRPQRLSEDLGTTPYQHQFLVNASSTPLTAHLDRISRATLWGQTANEDGDSVLSALEEVAAHSLAQAEYYPNYDGEESDYMWEIRWRARLRRVNFDDTLGPLGSALGSLGNGLISH